ncbi:hypothetical protein E1A91_D11G023100v1 [Gossypium mustelinum]|uniref:GST N-terminal domain-containing protein n=1 Tax=Gossypium mustelinum TaxID=34275 RepID=A0A5D2SM80_GOSMU|nr:hypothetical protein E1A91_D11G023100v1 [Gossypium mustelinum]
MKLKVYADRLSQPVRAVIIFCEVNGIDYEEIKVDLANREHLTPEFAEINPMQQLPAIVHGSFKLFESHAILIYLASSFPGVADHWYPADVYKRRKIHSVLDWHHSNLRRGPTLSKTESFWLDDNRPFLLGQNQPSIADLILVCDIMQVKLVGETDWNRLLGPYKKVQQWIENTRNATNPHFDELHKVLKELKEKLQN